MEASMKETIIILHGTWAPPELGKTRWYQPSEGLPTGEGFIAKLNDALLERRSPARCWAHCTQGKEIFHWCGENSWIARTHAAACLGDYVANLQREGWRCHIVAHSHGGNIVVEALPQIMSASNSFESQGKIVTLGTPFIDTKSHITRNAKRIWSIRSVARRVFTVIFGLAFVALILQDAIEVGLVDYFSNWWHIGLAFVAFLFIWSGLRSDPFPLPRTLVPVEQDANTIKSVFLSIGSSMDEIWQILHHVRTADNPLAIKSSVSSYVLSSIRSHMSRAADLERIWGAKAFSEFTFSHKFQASSFFTFPILIILFLLVTIKDLRIIDIFIIFIGTNLMFLITVLGLALYESREIGGRFYSSPDSFFWRWFLRLTRGLASVPYAFLIRYIRGKAWSLLVEYAMGLENYRFKLPHIEKSPGQALDVPITYEDMPTGAERRALKRRNAWVAGYFPDVSEMFSKITVTAADITSLLQMVERDQSLVHGAYYTDDECIARIADWISGRG